MWRMEITDGLPEGWSIIVESGTRPHYENPFRLLKDGVLIATGAEYGRHHRWQIYKSVAEETRHIAENVMMDFRHHEVECRAKSREKYLERGKTEQNRAKNAAIRAVFGK